MQGLRTKESVKFIKFFEEVQKAASKDNKVFFLDSGECMDIEFENMLIDEISGWLIPVESVEAFEQDFINNFNLEKFGDFYTWCIPQVIDGNLKIEFKRFE